MLTELKDRGLNDILIACVNGLQERGVSGSPHPAVHRTYGTQQPAVRLVEELDYKTVTRDAKAVYLDLTEEAGLQALEAFANACDSRYPQVSRSWQANWAASRKWTMPLRDWRMAMSRFYHRVR